MGLQSLRTHHLEHTVPLLEEPLRVDKYVAERLNLFTRSQQEKHELSIEFKGKSLKTSTKLLGGEVLVLSWKDLPEPTLEGEDLPIDIVYENESVWVVNKARGMVVHPAHGNWSGTLVQALIFRQSNLKEQFSQTQSDLRPGIVHRLDKDTTGILIAAKTVSAHDFLSRQFRDRTTSKVYWAVVKGELRTKKGKIQTGMARDPQNRQRFTTLEWGKGKPAETQWKILSQSGQYSLLELRPRTGRTHQLRVHMAYLKTPILGDPIYSRREKAMAHAPLMLHARSLTIRLSESEEEKTFTADLPNDFQAILKDLKLPVPPSFEPS